MSVGSGHFEFRLIISEVKLDDFGTFKLTVTNEVDSAAVEFTLVEGKYIHRYTALVIRSCWTIFI